jgi:hypothetical protein
MKAALTYSGGVWKYEVVEHVSLPCQAVSGRIASYHLIPLSILNPLALAENRQAHWDFWWRLPLNSCSMERRGRSTLPNEVAIGGYCLGLGSEGGWFFTAAPSCFGQESCGNREGTVFIPTDSRFRFRLRLAQLKFTWSFNHWNAKINQNNL